MSESSTIAYMDGENDVQKVNRMIISNNKSTYEFIAKIEMTANDLSYLGYKLNSPYSNYTTSFELS